MVLAEAFRQTQSALGSWWSGSSAGNQETLSKDIKIKSLYIHPIKSCKGTSVPYATYTDQGLKYDRQWLIIDAETKQFCTARGLSQMVLIHPEMDQDSNILRITLPFDEEKVTVEIPLEPTQEELDQYELLEGIQIWAHTVDGYAVSQEADTALSRFFGKPVRLVRKGPSERPSGPDDLRENATVNFQDFCPLLVTNEASIRHVQQTLLKNIYPSEDDDDVQDPLNMDVPQVRVPALIERDYWTPSQIESLSIIRFRPNVVLESTRTDTGVPALQPWEEDGFLDLEIFSPSDNEATSLYGKDARNKGKVGISCVARCARCTVPSIDPETGIRDAHLPYKMLQGYRIVDPLYKKMGKPSFGVLSTIRQGSGQAGGTLNVGDIVRVTEVMDASQRVSTSKKT
ncbi:unnamed protein product [Sympodiomycopsis kandeliae]